MTLTDHDTAAELSATAADLAAAIADEPGQRRNTTHLKRIHDLLADLDAALDYGAPLGRPVIACLCSEDLPAEAWEFIARARGDVLALAAEVRRLRAELDARPAAGAVTVTSARKVAA